MKTSTLQMLYYFRRLKGLQRIEYNELKEIQEKKLRKIIKHAYNNVQFYQDSFNTLNLKPNDITTVNDLIKLPIITKAEVRENYPNKIISRNIDLDNCHVGSTTGSTGSPLKLCFSNKEMRYRRALFNYFFSEAGANWYDQIFMIRHFSTSLGDDWKDKLKLAFFRR